MNCQEYRGMIEDALDVSIHGELERSVQRHLEHCVSCRNYFKARQAEHAALFAGVNAACAGLRLPEGFADRLAASVQARRIAQRGWRRFAVPRWVLIAASLVAMMGFVFAAAVVVERMTLDAPDSVGGDEPTAQQGAETTEAPRATTSTSSADSPIGPSGSSTLSTKGENTMKKGTVAAAALTAAMAAAPLAAANGDGYQFIVSGELVAVTEGCSSDASSTTALTSGTLADGFVYDSELEARYRTLDESNTCSLRSDKAGLIISFK